MTPLPPFEGPSPDLSGDNLEIVRGALSRLWAERAAERGLVPPDDLAGSCKFSSLLVSSVFGLEMRGSFDHQFCVTEDGSVVDLNENEPDVLDLDEPHEHDEDFWMSRDHRESLESCLLRVMRWRAVALEDIENRTSEPALY